MQIPVYNQQGQKISAIEVSDELFGVMPRPAVLHQIVVAQQANARAGTAHTKTRGEVRGGGKKPWRQKGTGRARHGSIRSPIWRGGGVVFGPRNRRNWTQKVNKKTRRLGLAMALSDKARSEHLVVVDALDATEKNKTKTIAGILKVLPLKRGRIMVALPDTDKSTGRALRNIDRVVPIRVESLNVLDLLNSVNLVTTVEGLKQIDKTYKPR